MAEYPGTYRISIDGRWSLEDLYRFPRTFEQAYFAFEAIAPAENKEVEERLGRVFSAFPWRGGYSAVDFYNQLKLATPPQLRPQVTRIRYSSPGEIELLLNTDLAIHIGTVVATLAASIGVCNKVYHNIHADLQRRKLLRIEVERKRVELSREELRLIEDANNTMAKIVGIETTQILDDRTQDPLKSLKILLSIYRRLRTLAEYKIKGKANLLSADELTQDEL